MSTYTPHPRRDPSIGVVVVNYGSHELLEQNLRWAIPLTATGSTLATGAAPVTSAPVRVVVVDNPRSPADTEAIGDLARRSGWELVSLPTNVGFGAGANAGAERALSLGCDVLCVVNPDVAITSDQVLALAQCCRNDPGAMVAPRITSADGRPWVQLGRIDVAAGRLWTRGGTATDGWLSGACLCLHRDMWVRLGGFDDDYFMYWEDVDLCYRCTRTGGRLRICDDVVVTHDVGGTQPGSAGKSSLYYFYNCRNRLLYAGKHLARRDRVRWVISSPADVRRVLSRGRFDGPVHKAAVGLPPALAGTLAGLGRALAPRRGVG